MARKPSKMVERTELVKVEAERDLLARVVQCIAGGEQPDAVETYREPVRDGGGWYRASLYRMTGADGGIVVVVFSLAGQRDSVRVYRLDDLVGSLENETFLAQRVAIDRLRVARDQAWRTK